MSGGEGRRAPFAVPASISIELPCTYINAHLLDVRLACHSSTYFVCHVTGPPKSTTPASRPMPLHGAFPPQLVDLVIDELGGEAHQFSDDLEVTADETLRVCALVSRKWAVRSRMHLFKNVRIEVNKYRSTPDIPPASTLPYIKKLKIWCDHDLGQVHFAADLLKAFSTSPIERLGITGAELIDKRACIQECIETHSATLQKIKFKACLLSAHNITDVVLGCHGLKRLRLVDCESRKLPPPGRRPIANTPNPSACSKAAELELSITGGTVEEGPAEIVSLVARLPHRFSRLEIDHVVYACDEAPAATNGLIEANADALSFLRIRILAGMFEPSNRKVVLLTSAQPHRT